VEKNFPFLKTSLKEATKSTKAEGKVKETAF